MLLQSDKKNTKKNKTRKKQVTVTNFTYRQSPVETLGVLTEESHFHFFFPAP